MATQDESLFERSGGRRTDGIVECLGLTFASDDQRRAHFTQLLREKLSDPEFRAIEGFPIGKDDDILALSDPPYYTACPNPWLSDLIAHYGKPHDRGSDDYEREPFAADISEGKSDPIYNAHSYHTKVPHRAIMRYILHYTEPGDTVFDGFCGTGMTGVAAQLCGDRKTVGSLGYTVKSDGTVLDEAGVNFSRLGARRAVLNDLSTAATFISFGCNRPVDAKLFEDAATRVLRAVEAENGWMYVTLHDPTQEQLGDAVRQLQNGGLHLAERAPTLPWATVNFTIWSEIRTCPECGSDVVFWDVAVDRQAGKVRERFACPACARELTKRDLLRSWETAADVASGEATRHLRMVPVLINKSWQGKTGWKSPDRFDIRLVEVCAAARCPDWFPTDPLPVGDKTPEAIGAGCPRVHDFYTPRNLTVLAALRRHGLDTWFPFSALTPRATKMHRIAASRVGGPKAGEGGATVGIINGTLFVPSISAEMNPLIQARDRIRLIGRALHCREGAWISTGSTTDIRVPAESIDYVFTDPPFGSNLMYSELNSLWEGWLRVRTNAAAEAVESRAQGKPLAAYQRLMTSSFSEYFRVLKPGRWMTVEFHNSANSVWMAIQEALLHAGFVVADVRTLDKQQGSFNQATAAGAVKQDLVISAYKPRVDMLREFTLEAGTPDGAWTFVRNHLKQLPVAVERDSTLEVVAERQGYLLFDRMVAFHVQRGAQVPLSAAEFYAGLEQRFACRDGMHFLPEQVAEYDRKRLQAREVQQLELFVTDEESAIQWLRRTLSDRPMTFQDLHPVFMREIAGWERHEKPLELSELLGENFIRYDGNTEVPSQIHAYLSSNFREMRGLDKNDSALRAKAKDRWFVPDSRKAGDLELLRERTLLKEFDDYAAGKGKLKLLRLEAVRAGFKRGWQERDYEIIISVAERLPADVLQEDAKLLMWYDQALTRAGE